MKGKNKKRNIKILLAVLVIIGIIMIMLGVTYAVFTYTKLGTTSNVITTGTLKFSYTENTGVGRGISLSNALPVTDKKGKSYTESGQVFDFTITGTNTSSKAIPYEITARLNKNSTLDKNVVKVYLTDITSDEKEVLEPTIYGDLLQTSIDVGENTEKTLYQTTVDSNTNNYEKKYRLRIWIDENTDFSGIEQEDGSMVYPYNNKTFTVTVNVYSQDNIVMNRDYSESILNGTDPVLKDNLVPIKIASDGTVTKADITKEWYNYENKEWANAVILKDETKTYNNGETIPESNIESYFVWIPRYKYQIFDEGNYTGLTSIQNKVQTINVVFENKDTTPSNGTTKGTWLTHPAFTSFDSNGFWVGKFETGYDGATSTSAAQVNSVDTSKIIIKPNVYSWRNITVGNMFKNSYDYQRSLDSHMMKNTEWGSVAYLQHSIYGSQSSIRINNNEAFITGYTSTTEPTLGYNGTSIDGNRHESTSLGVDGTYTVNYLNANSGVASTTGNRSGIYDMAGGAWEYVAGYTTGASTVGGTSGITSIYQDFFTNSTYTKYWDKYTSTTNTQYNNRILGDATGEMGPFGSEKDPDNNSRYKSSWYGDYASFAFSSGPWFARGGNWGYGTGSGAFAFGSNSGTTNTLYSFRIVLTPTV